MDEQSFQLQSDCGQCQPQCEFFSHSINSLEILINCFDDGDDDGDDGDGDDDVHDDDDDKPGEGDSVGVGGLGGEHCREERAWGEVIIKPARSARARRACALRALGLLLADGTPTVGGGKTF